MVYYFHNMVSNSSGRKRGFTLLELLVVIAIIAVLSLIVLGYLSSVREKGRDSNRATQAQEFLKALELYYSDNGMYPDDGAAANVPIVTIAGDLVGGGYIGSIPDDPRYSAAEGYQYCVSGDLRSMLLVVNVENDGGGSDYCHIQRGPGPGYGCTYSGGSPDIDAADTCADKF